MAVATHQPPPPIQLNPGLPPELSDLVMKLLEKDPDAGRQSAAAVVEGLQRKPLARPSESPDGHCCESNRAATSPQEAASDAVRGGPGSAGPGPTGLVAGNRRPSRGNADKGR